MNARDAISLDATRSLLNESRVYGLVEALHASVQKWSTDHHGPAIQAPTRAGIIADEFYWNATTLSLAGHDGMRSETVRHQRFITFDDRVLIRSKFVNKALESRNYQTNQARGFVRQQQIEGFPEFDRLHLAYRLDLTGMALRDVFITLPVGNRHRFNDWVWQIWGESIRSSSMYGLQRALPLPGFGSDERYYYEDYSQQFA